MDISKCLKEQRLSKKYCELHKISIIIRIWTFKNFLPKRFDWKHPIFI